MAASLSLSDKIEELHRCFYIDEVIEWLLANGELLGQHYNCAVPTIISVNKFRDLGMIGKWSFYLWMPNGDFEKFCLVLNDLKFNVHWIFYKRDTLGTDAYLSMYKKEWPIMAAYERLST